MRVSFPAGPDDDDRRLESVLRRFLPHQPLGSLHKALRKGDLRLNGNKASPDTKVFQGDTIEVWEALLAPQAAVPASPLRESEILRREWLIFENQDLVVVNKPSGLLVHAGAHPHTGEVPLDDRVRQWLSGERNSSLGFRPGPLHRLDRETSGLIVFSRTLAGARDFSAAIQERKVTKTYLAVLTGHLESPCDVDQKLLREESTRTTEPAPNGVEAVSRFIPRAWAKDLTLAEVDLGTGRTHQIRAHAAWLGHSLAGDRKYGGGEPLTGTDRPWILHAWKLSCGLFPPLVAPLDALLTTWVKKTFQFSV